MEIYRTIGAKIGHFKGKILFISGPRQAGKTFFVEHHLKPDLALNMDVSRNRIAFKQFPDFIIDWFKTNIGPFPEKGEQTKKPLVFIDEIHKVVGWRDIIKGTFDKTAHAIDYVASGSSAFKLRRQDKGDSLAGRAIWLNLFPVSFREYLATFAPEIKLPEKWGVGASLIELCRANLEHKERLRELWKEYAQFGSFPECLVRKDATFQKQWMEDYLSAMLDRDLKDLHTAKDVERVYQVFQLLLEGLGSTYSLKSMAETLGVSPNTVKSDVNALKQVLWGFDLPVANVSRAKQIRKEKKFYPMDFCFTSSGQPSAEGSSFECIAACTLKRGLYDEVSGVLPSLNLGFFRDYAKKETDFIVRDKKDIHLAIECKLKRATDNNLRSFLAFRPKEAILLVEEPGVFESQDPIYTISIELLAPCFA